MSNNKQSSVEWYAEEFAIRIEETYGIKITNLTLLSQAKVMEREQLIGLLEWMNSVSQSDPMRLETDIDDIVDMYLAEKLGGNK
jgi:hypothetical protein